VSRAALLAFGAGLTGVLAAWEALAAVEATRVVAAVRRIAAPLARAGREGRSPSALERRRLGMVAAGCLLTGGWLVAGPLVGAVASLAGPSLAVALVRTRRRRYAAELARGTPAVARALADAIGGGHSVRGAIVVAAGDVPGSAGHELGVTARALGHGEPTPDALEALRLRCHSRAWDTMIAAVLLQRQAGGDLAGLLRDLAVSLEGAARTERDAEATTAQARFTAWLVLALPLGVAALVELADPGFALGLLRHPVSAPLAGVALLLQACAGVCVHRLARSRGPR
jgi:tight adherence protein B